MALKQEIIMSFGSTALPVTTIYSLGKIDLLLVIYRVRGLSKIAIASCFDIVVKLGTINPLGAGSR